MKNLEPKVVIPIAVVVIVGALFVILRTAGVGTGVPDPPLASEMMANGASPAGAASGQPLPSAMVSNGTSP